jgi:hypothetical protein
MPIDWKGVSREGCGGPNRCGGTWRIGTALELGFERRIGPGPGRWDVRGRGENGHPSRAVITFDLPGGCPAGWTPYSPPVTVTINPSGTGNVRSGQSIRPTSSSQEIVNLTCKKER